MLPEFLPLVAHPVRWSLVSTLAHGDRRVGELTALVDQPQSLVSYHLGALKKAGLVTARRSSADGRDVYYRADLLRCRDLLGATGRALHPGLGLVPDPTPTKGQHRASVLFLCTGNSARSQMAEALLVHRSAGRLRARSAGSHPKELHPWAVEVMAERGIDIAGRPTKHLRRFARRRFDRVITLCDKVREVCPEFPGHPQATHWSMPDPSVEGDRAAFVRSADELEVRIELLMAELDEPTTRSQHVH